MTEAAAIGAIRFRKETEPSEVFPFELMAISRSLVMAAR